MKTFNSIFAVLVLIVLGTACDSSQPIEETRQITILYTNDEHGWMAGVDEGKGAANLAGLWDAEDYGDESAVLVLSGGDNWTGPAISTWFFGQGMVEVMNAMAYDASVIGNHEFDFGLDVLETRLREASFPYLSANMRYKKNGEVPRDLGIFGVPIMKVNEYYLDGEAHMELPFGVIENEPKVEMAANLGLWVESVWLPSVFITDPRVQWEAIDETTSRLVVPLGEGVVTLTAKFDPQTDLTTTLEAMRYRDAADEAKIPWRNEALGWEIQDGNKILSPRAVTWRDQGKPWVVFYVEDVVYNVYVSEYIWASGP